MLGVVGFEEVEELGWDVVVGTFLLVVLIEGILMGGFFRVLFGGVGVLFCCTGLGYKVIRRVGGSGFKKVRVRWGI